MPRYSYCLSADKFHYPLGNWYQSPLVWCVTPVWALTVYLRLRLSKPKTTTPNIGNKKKSVLVWFLVAFAVIFLCYLRGGIARREQAKTELRLRGETSNNYEADLREGFMEGCIYGGDTRKHCECMSVKVVDRYGVEGLTKINDWGKGMPKDEEKALEHIINLANTDKDFKDFVISVKELSASCE